MEISQSQLDSKRTSFRILFGKFVKDIKRFKNFWSNRIIPNCERILQFSSVAQSCPTLCDPMNRSTPGLPVHHQLPDFTETHVHRVSDAIQPSHPLSSPSPPAPNQDSHRQIFSSVISVHSFSKSSYHI